MPTISSRTPEGDPLNCPLCGQICLEMSLPLGDAPCPSCGQLVWFFRDGDDLWLINSREVPEKARRVLAFLQEQLGLDLAQCHDLADIPNFMNDIGADSIDTVELVMELEEVFDMHIPDDDARQIKSVQEAIRYLIRKLLSEPLAD